MKKIIKILPVIAAIMTLVIMTSITASAADSTVKPRYSETSSVSMSLRFNSNIAYCSVTVISNDSNIPIVNGEVTLTDSRGNVVATWSNLYASNGVLDFYGRHTPVTKGETYTMTITASVVGKTRVEHISESYTNTYK